MSEDDDVTILHCTGYYITILHCTGYLLDPIYRYVLVPKLTKDARNLVEGKSVAAIQPELVHAHQLAFPLVALAPLWWRGPLVTNPLVTSRRIHLKNPFVSGEFTGDSSEIWGPVHQEHGGDSHLPVARRAVTLSVQGDGRGGGQNDLCEGVFWVFERRFVAADSTGKG